ncbi:hypothetical protein [Rhizosaccharibacter radicis]|uniref:Uncharacterized protein n=1 Tax=Rhizosaccharibacter radicis TaxID=2782605 RepID=A0ABT1VY05_9PROT|nr:hypothetical protein [Acetobacteraceae bacterium KSS12]
MRAIRPIVLSLRRDSTLYRQRRQDKNSIGRPKNGHRAASRHGRARCACPRPSASTLPSRSGS